MNAPTTLSPSGSRWSNAYPALLLVTVLTLSPQASPVAAVASATAYSPAASLSMPAPKPTTIEILAEQQAERHAEQQAERQLLYVTLTATSSAPAATPAETPAMTAPAPPSVANAPSWAVALPADTVGQPCQDPTMFVANISTWSVPPGCYAEIYTPNPADYVARPGFGYCDWWPAVLHPNDPDLLYGAQYRRGSVPVPGAVVYEAPNVQGASSAGHYAQVVAVAPGGYWMLVTEMNFSWRGGGFGRVDYRYLHVGAGVSYIYP